MQTILGRPSIKQSPVDALEGVGAEPPPERFDSVQAREEIAEHRGNTPEKSKSHLDPPFNLAEQQSLGKSTMRKAGIN